MKIIRFIILTVIILSLFNCKDDPEEPYPDERIVVDNAQATLFFHTVFREAENAWAVMDSLKYAPGEHSAPKSTETSFKKLTYSDKTVTVNYNAWVAANLLLVGSMTVKFEENLYRKIDGAKATVRLSGFSINGQNVTGESSITFKKVKDNENDHYIYMLLNGASIYEAGTSMPVLISGAITNGQYERTQGNKTYDQKDDKWKYTGTMTGMIHDDPDLKYTNTVQTEKTTINGAQYLEYVLFTMDCITAKEGASKIVISGRPNILYGYKCTEYDFESITKVE